MIACIVQRRITNITDLLNRNKHTQGRQLFSKCQLGKMPQPLLFDEQTYFHDCLHSYPSVRMAWCPGRSWPKFLPWALMLSNNRCRWAVCITVHIQCLQLLFCAKHGTLETNVSLYIIWQRWVPKSEYCLKSPCSEVTTASHTPWCWVQSDYFAREECCGWCTPCDKMVIATTCKDEC